MYEDDESGYIRAFVISRRIVQVEDEVFAATGQQKSQGQKETEIFYKNLLDFQACGIFAYSLPGYQIISVNQEALRMLGYSSIEELQDNFQQVIGKISYLSQEDAEKLKALRTKDGSVDYECVFNKGQADERYVIAKSKIVYSLNGRRIAHTTYVDATEMRALQLSVE